ncbi:MAG: D-aminoacyl-tRNA deacylase [Flavobacteriales bacterium]|nr:D-aminoacyl-tRNA deacylase [Flavobacteriales bacterium]
MRALIQRVKQASVSIEGTVKDEIEAGLLVLLGVGLEDDESDIEWLSNKLISLRIFNDSEGVMNQSLSDSDGDLMIISQFTLHAKTKKGNRPSYIRAAGPDQAIPLYEAFIAQCEKQLSKRVARGVFGADMQVELINDGPVTIMIDSKEKDF